MTFFLFLLILLLFVLWLKVRSLGFRLDNAEARLNHAAMDASEALRRTQTNPAAPPAPPAPPATPAPKPDPMPEQAIEPRPQRPVTTPPPLPQAVAVEPMELPKPPAPSPVPPPTPRPPAAPEPSVPLAPEPVAAVASNGWESVLGSNILNKLGALVLVLGIALFLGYSFAHIGPAGRALMSLALSLSILTAGFFVEKKDGYRVFAAGLLACGWASTYFTAYAMHALPAARIIESPALGLIGMLATAAGMIAHSLRYRMQSLTALAYTCAFAALALTQLTSFATIALIPLAVSMLVIAYRFEWFQMGLFSAAATYTMLFFRGSPEATLVLSQSVVLIFWILFEIYDYLRRDDTNFRFALIAINAGGALAISAGIWHKHRPEDMWIFCTLWAASYLISGIARALPNVERRPQPAILLSAVLTALAIVAHVEGLWTAAALLVEAEILFVAGHYWNLRWLRVLSWPAFAHALLHSFSNSGAVRVGTFEFDAWALPAALHIVTFYANRYLRATASYFSYAATALTASLIVTQPEWPVRGAALLILSAATLELGLRRWLVEFRLQSYALFAAGILLSALSALDPSNSSIAWLATACAAAFAVTIRSARTPDSGDAGLQEMRAVRPLASLGAALLFAILPARILEPAFLDAIGNPRLGVAWIVLAAVLLELALRRLPEDFRVAAYPLALAGLIQTLTVGTTEFLAIKAALTFVPWTNPAMMCTIASIALSVYWYVRFGRRADEAAPQVRIASAIAGTVSLAILAWAGAPNAFTAILWMSLAVLIATGARATRSPELAVAGHILGVAATVAFFVSNELLRTGHMREAALAVVAGNLWLWLRPHHPTIGGVHLTIAPIPAAILCYREFPDSYVAGWAAMAALMSVAARVWNLPALGTRALTVAATALIVAVFTQPPALAVCAVIAMLYLLFALTPSDAPMSVPVRLALSTSASILGAFEIYREVDGGFKTIAWAVQGSLLLGMGFVMRERPFRLTGLALFLLCVLKVFIYDLPHLETIYRIISFIGLGVLLLAASWIYTRFEKQVKSIL